MARRLGDPDVLTVAINARAMQSFRHDGQAERQRLGAELLALPGKPVTAEAFASPDAHGRQQRRSRLRCG